MLELTLSRSDALFYGVKIGPQQRALGRVYSNINLQRKSQLKYYWPFKTAVCSHLKLKMGVFTSDWSRRQTYSWYMRYLLLRLQETVNWGLRGRSPKQSPEFSHFNANSEPVIFPKAADLEKQKKIGIQFNVMRVHLLLLLGPNTHLF